MKDNVLTLEKVAKDAEIPINELEFAAEHAANLRLATDPYHLELLVIYRGDGEFDMDVTVCDNDYAIDAMIFELFTNLKYKFQGVTVRCDTHIELIAKFNKTIKVS